MQYFLYIYSCKNSDINKYGVPRRMDYAPFRFFLCRKISHNTALFLLGRKTPARFTCSLVNALTTAHSRCHLFARKCLWHKWFKTDYAPFRFFYFPIIDCSQICFRRQVVGGTPNCFLKVLLKI